MAQPTKTDLGAFAAGEVPPDLLLTFADNDGNPINLSAFSNLQINIEEELDKTLTLGSGVISYVDATNGEVGYAWARPDMFTPGEYTVQAWVDDGTKYYASDLFIYSVYDGPGTPPA